MKPASALKLALKVAFSLGILLYLLSFFRSDMLQQTLGHGALWYVLLALAGTFFIQGLSTWKWQGICQSMGIPGHFTAYYRNYLQGMFIGQFMPSTVGGDVGRAVIVAREQSSPFFHVLLSIFCERVTGFAALLVFQLVGLMIIVPHQGFGALSGQTMNTVLLMMTLGLLAFALFLTFAFHWIEAHPWGQNLIRRLVSKGDNNGEKQTPLIWPTRPALWMSLGISVIYHILNIGMQMFLLQALGYEAHFWLVAAVYGVSNVLTLIPLSLNGLGIREGSTVMLYQLWGHIPKEGGVAFSLVWLSVILLSAIPGGVIMIVQQWHRRPVLSASMGEIDDSYSFPKKV